MSIAFGDGRPDIKPQLYQSDDFGDTKIGADKIITDCVGTVSLSQANARKRLHVKFTFYYRIAIRGGTP